MGAYDDDPRVRPHPDGTWMVFPSPGVELNVGKSGGRWYANDADGLPVAGIKSDTDLDVVLRALIGEPR